MQSKSLKCDGPSPVIVEPDLRPRSEIESVLSVIVVLSSQHRPEHVHALPVIASYASTKFSDTIHSLLTMGMP